MTKRELLENLNFGESIAELEAAKLKDYFLETEYWRQVRNGTTDIVYGSKGAGKSAIYTTLTNYKDNLLDEGTFISAAENPSGDPAFSTIKHDPPTTQTEFIKLWKLYFLVIAVNTLKDFNDENSNKLRQILIDNNLIPAQSKLASILKVCVDFARSFINSKEVSTTAEFDSVTGLYSGQKFSIAFGEPTKTDFEKGLIPIDYVYDLLNEALSINNKKLWITIDRLDVAFVDSEALEANALRALFKTYLDLVQHDNLKIKIFLRDDIWKRILDEGFREASHITKTQQITWNRESLLNLMIRRLLDNQIIVDEFKLNRDTILESIGKQEKLFYRFFPEQVDVGLKKLTTLEWVLSRTKDGKGKNTPREVIQLLKHARAIELKRLESGVNELTSEILISRQALKEAAIEVSKQRVEQTIYAEFPPLKEYMEALRGDKAEHSLQTLATKWGTNTDDANSMLKKLIDVGFFEVIGITPNQRFKIPFLYRPYFEITQGKAFSGSDEEDEE